MSNTTTTHIHINNVQPGDTVKHDDQLMTVGAKDIKKGGFMGTTLFGDSYRMGTKPVILIQFHSY